ncbi:MAG TPA: excalibur calcium-binding domain-containing protein [Kineosporiaceae bacterium]|jgi:hypothetical protein|nr:excalibur calcium-binding domain-containing protein [Kineosporiaceae bacterium]
MLALAVVIGWGAVGTGGGRAVETVAAPASAATVPPVQPDGAASAAARTSREEQQSSSSRSQDRLDPRFADCAAARAAGFGPYLAGRDAEYAWYPDADGDGVTCE